MKYSKLIVKKKEYNYSANLCFDLNNENKLGDFIPDIMTTEILREFIYGIVDHANVHSRILYGSYGTGKSHLLTVLCVLLGQMHTNGKAFASFCHAIAEYDRDFAEYLLDYVNGQKPYFVVPVYSDNRDFEKCISFSLKKELEHQKIDICFKSHFQEALNLLETWVSGGESCIRLKGVLENMGVELQELKMGLLHYKNEFVKIFQDVFCLMTYGATFVSEKGNLLDNLDTANKAIADKYQGIVFVFDEFGRYLEDIGEGIQVKSIQDMAEYCDHSGYNTHMILVSHKRLSLYTEKMKADVSDEWKKVEGRFRATSMNEKYDRCLSLISHIIPKADDWTWFREKYHRQLQDLCARAYDFKGFIQAHDETLLETAFPLHPITLYVLDRLSKMVAQNERTFFTYLVSDEENSLFQQLEQMDTENFHFVGLDMIYDYFEINIRAYRSDRVYEVYKKLQYARNKLFRNGTSQIEEKVLKAIAVINIIGDTAILASDRNTLKYIIDENDEAIDKAVDCLEQLKILKFMRQYGYYDFFDSSIYDFDSMIEEKVQGISIEMAMEELNSSFINFVIYPYDYNAKYHMNRILIPFFVQREKLNRKLALKSMPAYYDGILALVVDDDFVEQTYLETDQLPERSIFLVNTAPKSFMEEVKRYIAIKYFYSIREELKKEDPTASKELELYLEEQKNIVNDMIYQWRAFKIPHIQTYIDGEKRAVFNERNLTEEASRLMFRVFCKTMIVNNDIVNKNMISGTMKSSRKKVVSALIGENGNPGDFTPMSPEHTMIRSVLQKNGFINNDQTVSQNCFPKEAGELYGECSGNYVKEVLVTFIDQCTNAPVPFYELVDILKRAPFGLRDGYIPLLLAQMLKEFQNVGFYFHGDEKEFCADELLKACERPQDYSCYLCNWTEEQSEYISGLEKIFETYLTKNPKNRLKELLMAMNIHYAAIPKIARSTNRHLSDAAKKYREIMSVSHKDFHKFFFIELLQIENSMYALVQVMKRIYHEFEQVLPIVNRSVETVLREMLMAKQDETLMCCLSRMYDTKWKEKSTQIFDYQTNAFLSYIRDVHPDDKEQKVVEDIARLVVGFEIDYWNDDTIDCFKDILRGILEQLNKNEKSGKMRENEFQIIVKSGKEESVISTFHKCEMSQNGQIMFNKMKKTIHSFGQSITQEEKMVILTQLLSDI